MDRHTVFKKNENIITTEIDGKVVMMNAESGRYYGLDDIASAIWNRLVEPSSAKGLAAALTQEYDVSVELCEAEIEAFLARMHEEELIEII